MGWAGGFLFAAALTWWAVNFYRCRQIQRFLCSNAICRHGVIRKARAGSIRRALGVAVSRVDVLDAARPGRKIYWVGGVNFDRLTDGAEVVIMTGEDRGPAVVAAPDGRAVGLGTATPEGPFRVPENDTEPGVYTLRLDAKRSKGTLVGPRGQELATATLGSANRSQLTMNGRAFDLGPDPSAKHTVVLRAGPSDDAILSWNLKSQVMSYQGRPYVVLSGAGARALADLDGRVVIESHDGRITVTPSLEGAELPLLALVVALPQYVQDTGGGGG
jgi:hypothetical protein